MTKRKKWGHILGTRAMVFAILLSGGSPYGLGIIDECRRRTNGLVVPMQGNLYPILKQLEREKLVRSKVVKRDPMAANPLGGRPRIDYELTARGRREAEGVLEAIVNLFNLNGF